MGIEIIRIGYLSTFYHTSLLLQANKSIEDLLGVRIEWKLFGTGPAIMEAFKKNEIDIAYVGLTPVIVGVSKGLDIKCVAGGHINGTIISGTSIFRGFPEIQNLKDLFAQFKKSCVGIPAMGSIHDVIVRTYLKKYDLSEEVEIINYPWADTIVESFRKGDLQIAVGTPNLTVLLRRFAGAKILWPPEKLWPYSPSYGIVVRGDLVHEEDIIKKFIQLHEEKTQFLKRFPKEASEILSSIVRIVEPELILEVIQLSPHYCAMLTDDFISSTMRLMEEMNRLGYINRRLKEEEIFYPKIIKQLHPREGHY